MPNRIDSTEDLVLRVSARLRERFELPEAGVYETLDPRQVPKIPRGGDLCLSVALGSSSFDLALQAGGGAEQLAQQTIVQVTGYSQINLDRADRAESILHDVRRGTTRMKHQILAALVDYDLEDEDGNLILRSHILAQGASAPMWDEETGIAMVSVAFLVEFDWDMQEGLVD